MQYCADSGIEFTRSRAYRKNDQVWIEQKNGAVIRRFVGYDRYTGHIAGQTLAHLYGALRLFVNYFQPSFKLVEKTRDGARVTKRYDKPATPLRSAVGARLGWRRGQRQAARESREVGPRRPLAHHPTGAISLGRRHFS